MGPALQRAAQRERKKTRGRERGGGCISPGQGRGGGGGGGVGNAPQDFSTCPCPAQQPRRQNNLVSLHQWLLPQMSGATPTQKTTKTPDKCAECVQTLPG